MEVRRHLRKHDIPDNLIDDVIERLQRGSLVDDRRFAHNWVENRVEFRPRGRRALAHELQQKGISAEIIQEALDHCDDEELAYRAANKQSTKYINLDWNDYRKKMFGFLARRGFSYQVSAQVVTRVWEELNTKKITDDSYTNEEVDA
jgi:regulatory protein